MPRTPVDTPLGRLRGRDCVFLSDVELLSGAYTLAIHGELNGDLCERRIAGSFIPYKVTFSGVLALRMIELDSWQDQPASSFDEVLDSAWLRELGGKVQPHHRHFALQTYDHVFDVVCEGFQFDVRPPDDVTLALRRSALLSIQRALVGEITPEMRAVAVNISRAAIRVLLFVDEGAPADIIEAFDAGAMTQIVADFCWPERGDPEVSFEHVQVPLGETMSLPDGYSLVFQRADLGIPRPP